MRAFFQLRLVSKDMQVQECDAREAQTGLLSWVNKKSQAVPVSYKPMRTFRIVSSLNLQHW